MQSFHINRFARENCIEMSLDAAIELEQVLQKKKDDAPSLKTFTELMLGSKKTNQISKKDLLSNPQIANLYRRASGIADGKENEGVDKILTLFGKICEVGIKNFSAADLEFIRDFCLGVNRQLINESYGRIPMPSTRKDRFSSDGQRAWT
jgi:hypothetical protein